MDNFQDITNSFTPIDPIVGMTQGGVSDTSAIVDSAVANYTPMEGSESLSDALKRISNITMSTFADTGYTNNLSLGQGLGTGGGILTPDNITSQLFRPSGESSHEIIDLDQYYTRMGSAWDNADKDSAAAIGILGGAATGAATGAAVGSLASPVGTAIGAVVGGILGGIEGYKSTKSLGYGYVRNKEGINEEALAQKQGFWGRMGTGFLKMAHTADSMALGSLNFIGHIPQALAEGSTKALYDNDFAKILNDFDKSSDSANKVYHSNAYKNSSLLGSLTHSEFWADKALPAVGFMVGAMAVGRGTNMALAPLGIGGGAVMGASRAALTETATSALASGGRSLASKALINSFKQAVKKDLASTTVKSLTGNLTSLITSAAPEAGLEARGAMDEAREDYIRNFKNAYGYNPSAQDLQNFEVSNVKSANGVFAANLAVVGMSNWIQFGNAMGLDRVLKKGLLDGAMDRVFGLGVRKTMSELSETGVRSAVWNTVNRTTAQKVGHRVFSALESPITEGLWEEGIQSVISGTHKNYLESRYNPNATEINKNILKSFGESFAHTYTSREGWDEIMVGMIVGGLGSASSREGFLGQKGVSARIKEDEYNAANLNKTQGEFVAAYEDLLEKQKVYNKLNNSAITGVHDKMASLNQQISGVQQSKMDLASGNIEQANINYNNALFAKMAAERRAGLTESSKFDMETMVENIPDEVLSNLGFNTQEQRDLFKEDTKKSLMDKQEAFDAAYDLAEQLNLGAGVTNSVFSPNQVTEAAALHLFHGLQSADNANNIAQAIEKSIGINGVASSLHYYDNIDSKNKERLRKVQENNEKVKELEHEVSMLLTQFSTNTQKIARENDNEKVVSGLDETSLKIQELNNQIQGLQAESNSLTEILNDQANIPRLPFGNPAYKFFDSIGLNVADKDAMSALDTLNSLEKYISHLSDTTGKTTEEIEVDRNKVEMLESLLDSYKKQMSLMRNFAKVSQMVGDKAYNNNLAKTLFNRKKYDALFDNEDWINNNESNFDEMDMQEFKALKDKINSGKISKFDVHTYLTNVEILRLGHSVRNPGGAVEQQEEDIVDTSDEVPNTPPAPTVEEAKNKLRLQKIRDRKLAEKERELDQKYDISKIISGEQEFEGLSPQQSTVKQWVDADTLVPGDRVTYLGKDRIIKDIKTDLFGVAQITFEDGDVVKNNAVGEDWKIEKITKEATTETTQKPLPGDVMDVLTDAQRSNLELADSGQKASPAKIKFDSFEDLIKYADSLAGKTFNVNGVTVKFVGYKGSTLVGAGQRVFVKVEINGVPVTYYSSTGSGKKALQEGVFYPTIGVESDDRFNGQWINKLTAKDMARYYNSPHLAIVGSFIDSHFGNVNQHAYQIESRVNKLDNPLGQLTVEMALDIRRRVKGEHLNSGRKTFSENEYKNVKKAFEDLKEELDNSAPSTHNSGSNNDTVNESEETPIETTSEPTLEDILNKIAEIRENELNKIHAQYTEALNPTQKYSKDITTKLDKINEFIDGLVKDLEEAGKVIDKEFVDTFSLDDKVISKEIYRVNELLRKETLEPGEQEELDNLLNKVDSYGLVEGRVSDLNGTQIRLSDLLEQRAQLENELFSDNISTRPLDGEEMHNITFDTDESELPTATGNRVGDAAVLNSYEFTTFTPFVGGIQISNHTPQGFTEQVIGDSDSVVQIIKQDGSVVDPQGEWDRQAESGDTVVISLVTGNGIVEIPFTIDSSRRVILTDEAVENLSDHTRINFKKSNRVGSSAHYVVTVDNNGTEVYLGSDFSVDLDSKAAQRLNPGDPIFFEYDADSDYNNGLEEELDRTDYTKDIRFEMVSRAKELLEEFKDATKERKDEIRTLLKSYFPTADSKIPAFRKAVKSLEKSLKNEYPGGAYDEARIKFKQNMRIVAVDSQGNRVGIVKAVGNSSVYGTSKTQLEALRNQLFEQLQDSGFTSTRTKFSVPVRIMYMGIPNISADGNGKVEYSFSTEQGDRNIDPESIVTVGYVTHGSMKFQDNYKLDTPYNYAKKIMTDETYNGVKVPVVVFRYQGKDVIYPISLKSKSEESLEEQFSKIIAKQEDSALSDVISEANKFLAENGIDKKIRITSLDFKNDVDEALDTLGRTPNTITVEELMVPGFRDVLADNASIDINILDKPFVGPKIRFDLGAVPNVGVAEEVADDVEIPQNIEEEIEDNENKTCLE